MKATHEKFVIQQSGEGPRASVLVEFFSVSSGNAVSAVYDMAAKLFSEYVVLRMDGNQLVPIALAYSTEPS